MARPGGVAGISRPSAPNISRPSTPNITRPSTPNFSRPSTPNISRPSTPIARPSTPAVRPSNPSFPGNGSLPNFGGNAGTKPSLPVSRPNLPISKPGGINEFPSAGTRPSLPNRPDVSRPDIARPGTRPSPGNVGDFLGIPGGLKPGDTKPGRPTTLPGDIAKPTRPDRPTTLPGDIAKPSRPTLPDRPGNLPDRPSTLPARPGDIARPGQPDRPQRPDLNRPNNIYNKPSWVNINNNQINNINTNIGNIVNNKGMGNWINNHPNRGQYWNNWGNGIHCHPPYNRPWFGNNWWNNHGWPNCGWHYRYWNGGLGYGWNYWYRAPIWTGVATWFQPWGWQQPVYYDYGTGGNVVYNNDIVYIDGQQVASAADYAQSAATLATVAPPETEEQAEKVEWMPLGTFALSTSENDTNPSRVLQLAVSKDGIISGTMFNSQTDKSYAVQGQVDKKTQRVAFRIGDSDKIVAETGIYNLTQEEAPLLVHFGTEKTETYLLKRLEAPEEEAGASQDF